MKEREGETGRERVSAGEKFRRRNMEREKEADTESKKHGREGGRGHVIVMNKEIH